MFAIASDAPTLAGATTVSAFQPGISLVPFMADIAFETDVPITTVAWIGAGLAAIILALALAERATTQRETTR